MNGNHFAAVWDILFIMISSSILQLSVLKGVMKETETAHYLGNASAYLLFFLFFKP